MAIRRTKKTKILRLALLVFAVYVVSYFIIMQIDIENRRTELLAIEDELKKEEYINKELTSILKFGKSNEYIMKIAREKLGYVFPEERVFVDSGNSNE